MTDDKWDAFVAGFITAQTTFNIEVMEWAKRRQIMERINVVAQTVIAILLGANFAMTFLQIALRYVGKAP